MKYENCSERCVVDYFQYYKKSYDEPELEYITYNTPDDKFHIYTYFGDHWMYKNLSHIYANETTRKHGSSMPILKLPLDKYPLDVTDIEAVHKKIATLALFVWD